MIVGGQESAMAELESLHEIVQSLSARIVAIRDSL